MYLCRSTHRHIEDMIFHFYLTVWLSPKSRKQVIKYKCAKYSELVCEMWNVHKKDELMSCLVMNSSRVPGFPSDQAVSAAALTYTEWVTPHSHHKYNAFYVNKAKMEDSEGNKEKNVVKVLAKRPPQSTETEVQLFSPYDLGFSRMEKYFR